MSYPTVLPRPNVFGPGWINRRFVREPRPFLQRMIDEQLEPLQDELWFTRKLLFENEQLGHFLERMQAAEENALSLEAAKEAAEEAEVAAEERTAAAEEKVIRKKAKIGCWKEEFNLAAEKAEKLEKETKDKDQALSNIRAENAQLQGEVARMKAAKEDAVASQNRLVTRHATLWTENERLRGKLAVGNKSSIPQDARCREEGWPKAYGQAGREGFAEALRPESHSGGGEKAQQSCQKKSV